MKKLLKLFWMLPRPSLSRQEFSLVLPPLPKRNWCPKEKSLRFVSHHQSTLIQTRHKMSTEEIQHGLRDLSLPLNKSPDLSENLSYHPTVSCQDVLRKKLSWQLPRVSLLLLPDLYLQAELKLILSLQLNRY